VATVWVARRMAHDAHEATSYEAREIQNDVTFSRIPRKR
jgi:hypothetical protein